MPLPMCPSLEGKKTYQRGGAEALSPYVVVLHSQEGAGTLGPCQLAPHSRLMCLGVVYVA